MPDIRGTEAFERFLDVILSTSTTDRTPWTPENRYRPDYTVLQRLLSVPVRQGAAQQSGRLARATDAWVAHELRCAGFGPNEVWPRAKRPRVLPQPLAGVEAAAGAEQPAAIRRVLRGWSQAYLLGQYYRKQVDVVIADWDRGPELIVSTKSMLSSYWNNLRNRFEEFVGDARNLRGRYPLAAIGILFVVRSTITEETGAFDFLVDMLIRLRNPDLYDTAGLLVVRWDDDDFGSWKGDLPLTDANELAARAEVPAAVSLSPVEAPELLKPDRFLADLISCVLTRTPVTYHVRSRELRAGRAIPVKEEHQGAGEPEPDQP
jgi:hypothetical protein